MLNKEERVLAAYIKSKYYYKVQRIKNCGGYLILKPYAASGDSSMWVPFCNILFKTLSEAIDYLELENTSYDTSEIKEAKCKAFLASITKIN